MHYLPLAPGFFAILVGFFFIVLIVRSVRYAYESLGVSSNTAIVLLLATLIGSFFNIPIMELSPERAMSHHHVDFFGMRYAVPAVSHWKGTLVAVNVGGAVIPILMSICLAIVLFSFCLCERSKTGPPFSGAASPLIEVNVFERNPALYIRGVYKRNRNDDQVDDGTANVGSWHGNHNDGNRSAGLVGWL